MRRSPSSSALQTYTVVLVRDKELRQAINKHAGNQPWIDECPLFIVGCADLRRVEAVTQAKGYPYRASDLRILISSTEDVTIAIQNASLAARSLDLATVMIGGVLNGTREIAELLNLPPRIIPLLGLCIGYTDAAWPEARPRLPKSMVFHIDRYSLESDAEQQYLEQHDTEVVAQGYYHGRHIPITAIDGTAKSDLVRESEYGWTEHVARKQARLWWLEASEKLASDFRMMGLRLID
jgi:nitroreductase